MLRGGICSNPPFGYQRLQRGGPFVIVPEQADIVRYIYKQFLSGGSFHGIAMELSQRDIRTKRGNLFDGRQVERALTNPIYKGWGDVCTGEHRKRYTFKAEHEPIISEDIFDQVQELIRSKKDSRTPKVKRCHTGWLSGKLRCPQCGGAYYRRSNNHGTSFSYICTQYAKGRCSSPTISEKKVLEKILLELRRIITDDTYQPICSMESVLPLTEKCDAKIKENYRKLDRLLMAYEGEVIPLQEYEEDCTPLWKEIERLEAEKVRLLTPNYPELKKHAFLLYEMMQGRSSIEEKQAAIDRFVEHIAILPNREISVIYRQII